MARAPYRIFQPTYKDRASGETKTSPTFHVSFRDHLHRRQTLAGYRSERDTTRLAERVVAMLNIMRTGASIDRDTEKWLQGLDPDRRDRLIKMEVIDARTAAGDRPLVELLTGATDEAGNVTLNGWKQSIEARNKTADHVKHSVSRVKRIIEGCGFVFWRDMVKPGAETLARSFLEKLRKDGKMSTITIGYHVRDLKSFCRWLYTEGYAGGRALADMRGPTLDEAKADEDTRRPLSVEEMAVLLAWTASDRAPFRYDLTGNERALLYRFAFESGIRPKQIRALTVERFDLEGTPPTVSSPAAAVKRRKRHNQTLKPALAQMLAQHFQNKLPTAPAFRMPSEFNLADMLRADMADGRAAWIEAAKEGKPREIRQRSDFLAEKNREGERVVFYSLRHGHGTALALAGVSQELIAASMHHTNIKTTERYIHAQQQRAASAIASMPDLTYPVLNASTGTD